MENSKFSLGYEDMTVNEFSAKYGICVSAIHVAIGNGSIPRDVLSKNKYDVLEVDENWFIRRIEFRNKVKLYIQDMYFMVSDVVRNHTRMGKIFGVAHVYWNSHLWQTYTGSILTCKINGSDWKVFRKMRGLERKIKRLGVNFNIGEILDMEAGLCHNNERRKELTSMRRMSRLIMQEEMQNSLPNG